MKKLPIIMKLTFAILSDLFLICSATAQNGKPQFSSSASVGFTAGQSPVSLVAETVNGIKFSNWFTGIGIGLDNYRYKTLPLFIDGKWHFSKEKNAFLWGDIGYNFPMKNKPGKEIYYYNSYHFTGGVYTGVGLGFQTVLHKKLSAIFSFGYSYKELENKIGVVSQCLVAPCPVDYNKYDYRLGRMIMKTGIVF